MSEQDHDKQHGKEEPILIKKVRKGGHGGHHGGAWKVAYADFVTAMMAFFIVMWILASGEKVQKLVSAYFENPGAFSFIDGKMTIPIDLDLKPEAGKGEGEGKGVGLFKFDEEMADSVVSKLRQQAIRDSVEAMQRVKFVSKEIEQLFDELKQQKPNIEDILNSIEITMTKEGLRIELIEEKDRNFFEIGSADLNPQVKDVLEVLAREIGKLPNYVEIEGHTDSRGYSSQAGYSNWELSADRANSARRFLQHHGLWTGQITRVTGYADRKLKNADNPFDITNRRVSLLIKNLTANDFMPSPEG
ncbi:MAG: flagellar motor protein MotB [Candidatus Kapaibacterium sp.]